MNVKGLGKKQKAIIHYLQRKHYIHVFADLSNSTKDIWLKKEDNCIAIIPETWFNSLVKREIIVGKMVYSTVQPDTESWKFVINPECKQEQP